MRNLIYRVVTALCLLPLVIAAFVIKGYFLLFLLGVVSLVSIYEAALIVIPKRQLAIALVILYWGALYLPLLMPWHYSYVGIWFFMIFFVNSIVLFCVDFDAQDVEKITSLFYWSFYIVTAIGCVQLLTNSPILEGNVGMSFLWLCCISTWSNDTCAYVGGRLFGRHPLFERVSQKKTWEGFFAGGLGMLVMIGILQYSSHLTTFDLFKGLSVKDILWVSLPLMALAPLGDLIESRFKRLYHVKDSSQILPGHGGVLDRIDGLLMTIPWTTFYAFLIRSL